MTEVREWPTCESTHDSNIHTRSLFLNNLRAGTQRFNVSLYDNNTIAFPKRIYITQREVKYPRFYEADNKELASGSYGAVVRYALKNGAQFQEPQHIVVKGFLTANMLGMNDFEVEKRVIQKLNEQTSCTFSRVNAAWPMDQNEKYIFMENMQGSLEDWKHKLTIKQTLKIMREVTNALDCMMSQNLYYTDVKLQNILYKCKHKEYGIYIGDYGSAAVKKISDNPNWYGVATYPRFNQPIGEGYVERDEKNLVYGVFIVGISLASMFASNGAFIKNLGYMPGRENKTTFLGLTQFLDNKTGEILQSNPNIDSTDVTNVRNMCAFLKRCLDDDTKLSDIKTMIDALLTNL